MPPPAASKLRAGRREAQTRTIAMVDLDFFKRIDDTLSHDVGDRRAAPAGRGRCSPPE